VGGSASAVTHGQLDRLEAAGVPCCGLPPSLLSDRGSGESPERQRIIGRLGESLARGCVILRPFAERLPEARQGDIPIPQRITDLLAETALSALRASGIDRDDLAMILVGGDTALGVLDSLSYGGIGLAGELMAGIVKGNLRGGPWEGLTIVTKAGAFGQEDALLNIVERLQEGG
jgi:uncharacterized protein YgbK (DUF1537 family)